MSLGAFKYKHITMDNARFKKAKFIPELTKP